MSTVDMGDYTVTTTQSTAGQTVQITFKVGTLGANQGAIAQNVIANQALIQQFIANNPTGAVLTAAQTLILAKMLNGLCNLLLAQFGTTAGT
jgi:hypothetical protein